MNAIANLEACIGVTIVTRIGKTFFFGLCLPRDGGGLGALVVADRQNL
jgi:hypothetical protein